MGPDNSRKGANKPPRSSIAKGGLWDVRVSDGWPIFAANIGLGDINPQGSVEVFSEQRLLHALHSNNGRERETIKIFSAGLSGWPDTGRAGVPCSIYLLVIAAAL